MDNEIELPYYATDVPCPLPTEIEIDAAPDFSLAYGGRRIVAIGSHFVVKFGPQIDLVEGRNMLFVRENTKIPVPRVYALYSKNGKGYIVMERIYGEELLSAWKNLESKDKKHIIETLRVSFEELRALKSPGFYGSLGKRHLLDSVFWTHDTDPAINGPFDSEEAFLEALPLKYLYDGRSKFRAEFYRQCLPRVLQCHQPVFTHGDFQRKNIIIRKSPEESSSDDPQSWQIVILDWEKSGWYPSYWEYCMAYCALRWDDDWCLQIQGALEPYVSAASWFYNMRLELWS